MTYRSGLEEKIQAELDGKGVPYEYEAIRIPYTPILKVKHYVPDFTFENGICIESKGWFISADRQKHKAILEQYPALDLRFLFSNAHSRLSKASKTTYAVWCDTLGIKWAHKVVPAAWLTEPVNHASLEIINQLRRK